MAKRTNYDVVVIGGGHNGLVSACYLAKAGLSVLVLERSRQIGGATRSKRVFSGFDARLSVYSYLVSLFPQKIIDDLSLDLQLRDRRTASWTPVATPEGGCRDLLIRTDDPRGNQNAFRSFCGNDEDYYGCLRIEEMQRQLASVVWPSLTEPLVSREEMRRRLPIEAIPAWDSLIEEPIGLVIEREIRDDTIRGILLTDARIGLSVHPHEKSLLQNRCFLYHVIGNGTGQWRVPVGGMGSLVDQLYRTAIGAGVEFISNAEATRVATSENLITVQYIEDQQEQSVDARFALCNASADIMKRLLGESLRQCDAVPEGAGFKMNMLLERLPRLKSTHCTAAEAFAGTVHINEGYQQQLDAYEQTASGQLPSTPPGEIYCHTLTDDSILSPHLRQSGFHTITLFGLDMPYRLFAENNEACRSQIADKYLAGINQYLAEPIEDCLARDSNGQMCIEAKSAVDLESELSLPGGNIFHGDLSWPFTDHSQQVGCWGVESSHPRVLLCGSAAARGGAVSGIPGHNAAMRVLERIRSD